MACVRLSLCLLAVGTLLMAAPAQAQSQFNGRWTVVRSNDRGCVTGGVFTIRIKDGVVRGPGGRGSVSASGRIDFPGEANHFSGTLRDRTGSGTYVGKCSGTFTTTRN